jgi:hypothetical protein
VKTLPNSPANLIASGSLEDGRFWELYATGSVDDLFTYLSVSTADGTKTLGGGHAGPALGLGESVVSASVHLEGKYAYIVGRTDPVVESIRLYIDPTQPARLPIIRTKHYPDLGFFCHLATAAAEKATALEALDRDGRIIESLRLRWPPRR